MLLYLLRTISSLIVDEQLSTITSKNRKNNHLDPLFVNIQKVNDKPRWCIKKQRHHFADKGPYSQSYGFSSSYARMWELDHKESWEWTTDAFKVWCWRRLLRVSWTTRRWNQSILKEISPEYSLEGLMLKLKLQYFGHLMQRADSLEKTLIWGKIEGRRRRG